MKKLRVMDSSGDSLVEFEAGTAAEQQARELFGRLMEKNSAVFAVDGGESRRVRDFDALGQENVVVPAIVGG